MPITQERMISMIEVAEALKSQIGDIRRFTQKAGLDNIIQTLNRLQVVVPDANSKQTIEMLRNDLWTLYQYIFDNKISDEMNDLIIAERAHFQAHAKQNERTKRYLLRKRLGLTAERQGFASAQAQARAYAQSREERRSPAAQSPQAQDDDRIAPDGIVNVITTYDEHFVPPPERTIGIDDAPRLTAPLPGPPEALVAKLMREAEEREAAINAKQLYAPPAAGDDYKSRGEAPDVPLPGTKVF